MKHGNESYFIVGEGLIRAPLFPLHLLRWIFSLFRSRNPYLAKGGDPGGRAGHEEDDDKPPVPKRRFCRLFDKGAQADDRALVALGSLMETESGGPNDNRDSNIPAGYTYLGQFIDQTASTVAGLTAGSDHSQHGRITPIYRRRAGTAPATD